MPTLEQIKEAKNNQLLILKREDYYDREDDEIPYVAKMLTRILGLPEDKEEKCVELIENIWNDRSSSVNLKVDFETMTGTEIKVLTKTLNGLPGLKASLVTLETFEI